MDDLSIGISGVVKSPSIIFLLSIPCFMVICICLTYLGALVRLIIFFVAKDGEALYSQQKQDRELTVAHSEGTIVDCSCLRTVTGPGTGQEQSSPGRCLLAASAGRALPGNLRAPALPPVPPG